MISLKNVFNLSVTRLVRVLEVTYGKISKVLGELHCGLDGGHLV